MSVKDYPPQPGRHGYVVHSASKPDEYVLIRDCPICKRETRVIVPGQGLWNWEHGELIQVAFPNLTPDQREQVITGIHGPCWDQAMADDV